MPIIRPDPGFQAPVNVVAALDPVYVVPSHWHRTKQLPITAQGTILANLEVSGRPHGRKVKQAPNCVYVYPFAMWPGTNHSQKSETDSRNHTFTCHCKQVVTVVNIDITHMYFKQRIMVLSANIMSHCRSKTSSQGFACELCVIMRSPNDGH